MEKRIQGGDAIRQKDCSPRLKAYEKAKLGVHHSMDHNIHHRISSMEVNIQTLVKLKAYAYNRYS